MRNFSWDCFQSTGNIDAYLLYKDLQGPFGGDSEPSEDGEEQIEENN